MRGLATDGAGRRGWSRLVNYVRVQLFVAFIDAVGIGVGAFILGVPLALPLGVLVFIGSFIPILGAHCHRRVAVLLALVANGWVNALIMLAIVLVVQQAESHILQPLIMGKAVSLHPLAVVLAVAGGSMVAGIPGALFAVPTMAIAQHRGALHRGPRLGNEPGAGHPGPTADGPQPGDRRPPTLTARPTRGPVPPTAQNRPTSQPRTLAESHRCSRRPNCPSPSPTSKPPATLLEGVIEHTPVEHSRALGLAIGSEVFLKCENLQRAGSFKVRGAYVRMAKLSPEEKARGVVAASAGNHAQGVAQAARRLGIKARIYMPLGVALPKLTATRDHGAEVVLHGHNVDEALAEAAALRRGHRRGLRPPLRRPGHHRRAGHDRAGDAGAAPRRRHGAHGRRRRRPAGRRRRGGQGQGRRAGPGDQGHRRAGGERRRVPALPRRGRAGPARAASPPSPTASRSAGPGQLPFQIIRELVDDVVTVSEDALAAALVFLLERSKLVVEPAGAVGVAALLDGKLEELGVHPKKIAVILSGGNIDPLLMLKVIQRGLSAAGRYLTVRIMLDDRPG